MWRWYHTVLLSSAVFLIGTAYGGWAARGPCREFYERRTLEKELGVPGLHLGELGSSKAVPQFHVRRTATVDGDAAICYKWTGPREEEQ